MAFRLVASVKRSGSTQAYFQQRIPKAVRERAVGLRLAIPVGSEAVTLQITEAMETVRVSLRTSDPSTAKVRLAEVAAYVETVWQSLRAVEPVSLTHRQCVALAGDLFRAGTSGGGRTLAVEFQPATGKMELVEDTFIPPEGWQSVAEHLEAIADEEDLERLEPAFGPLIDSVLRRRGLGAIDAESRAMILREFRRAQLDAIAVRRRQAAGDYSPADEQDRFPKWEVPEAREAPSPANPAPGAKLSLVGLVGSWWEEAKPAGRTDKTRTTYEAIFKRLSALLGHDDARAVTAEDIVSFKAHRLASGVSTKTVKDSDIAGLKSVFAVAVANRVLPTNPADGIKVIRAKAIKTRPKGFTAKEAAALLSAASAHRRTPWENAQTAAAKRWVPWLCAYTGARVGELVQLRRQDVRKEGGLWVITITPEAGTVKDKELREVVLHAHLVEMGFPDFVTGSKAGHLFFSAKAGEDTEGKRRATKNRLAVFARETVTDPGVAPNHGWRHLFKTLGREAGIEDSVLDAICGHAPGSIGGSYGSVSLKAQAAAFERFPRFDPASAGARQEGAHPSACIIDTP
ncbi:DUF6538 domain-containing protein [Aureimonas mangrovi]|uniref:DUF6538 domain-containing protein n=1 Tax=Aureimonas mangrovi TaxID=2758041 RepID=UPI00163DE424|nr:tyrosine-type recombinase/integrase [Aureimonas mangrovi]